MTTEELAIWADKSPKYISKNKKSWCAKNLNEYAEYTLITGGVNILKIKNPYFQTSARKKVKAVYYNHFGYYDSENDIWIHADTSKHCYEKIVKSEGDLGIKVETGAAYVGEARREDFGTAIKKNKREGKRGSCCFAFGKIIDNEFYFFTPEEEKIKKELAKKYFHDMKEELIEEQQKLNWGLKHKELSLEEYAEAMNDLLDNEVNWIDYQLALEEALGVKTDFRVLTTERAWEINAGSGSFNF